MDDSAQSPQNWFSAYTRARRGQLRASSRKVYGAWWARFAHDLAQSGGTLATATPQQVRTFLANYPGNTGIRYYRLLLSVYDAACERALCKTNPLAGLRQEYEREEESVPAPAAPPELLNALYSIKPGPTWKKHRDRTLVLVAAETGLRRRELISLEVEQLQLDSVPARLRIGTSSKRRDLDLDARIRSELLAWLEVRKHNALAGDLVFPAAPSGESLDPSTVYRIIERHMGKAGAGKGVLGSSGTQVLRASLAQRTKEEGTGMPELQAMLGHKQLKSTADLVSRLAPVNELDAPKS